MRNKQDSVRDVALGFLIEWEENEAYSNLLLSQTIERTQLNDKDRRLFTELVYGSIQRLNTLDWIINNLVKKGTSSLEVWVRQLLRISIYQLFYLDRIPEHAAVNEAVRIAKQRGHKGISGLINGVLRSFLRQKDKFMQKSDPGTLKEKELTYSHPAWMIESMEKSYGEDETKKMLLVNNIPPKMSVRVNHLKMSREEWIKDWENETKGTSTPSVVSEHGAVILSGGNPASSSLFKTGRCTIQDESSMLVAKVVSPKPGMNVLDVCAAPGGKTTHLAEIMENQGNILACDIHEHKIKLIESNAQRLGISIIKTKLIDGRSLTIEGEKQFDAILLDAPCSGLGVIRRKPDIKWRKTLDEIDKLVILQQELLHAVVPLLKPGGILVYSTCTTEKRENLDQIKHFLKNYPDFEISPFHDLLTPFVKEKAIMGDGWMQILPHHFDTDGFFIAKLQKKVN